MKKGKEGGEGRQRQQEAQTTMPENSVLRGVLPASFLPVQEITCRSVGVPVPCWIGVVCPYRYMDRPRVPSGEGNGLNPRRRGR